ncbi:MAG: Gfo/Idh/MocA family oxidoreductase [Clostridia bacterium]|nr:Gfo/Idh/MocA family oxidoreductase [Clostridia bacterium]
MEKLNIALIGLGRSGMNIHGKFFLSDKNTLFNVVAVCDEIEVRAIDASIKFECAYYTDYREMLKRQDIDVILNSTFSYEHSDVAVDCLNAGKNVVSEKPFAQTAEQCDRMIEAAERNGVSICPFQQSRFAPYYTRMRDIVRSGVLGRILEIKTTFSGFSRRWDWQCSQRFGGGNMYNTGPHPFDMALDMINCDDMPQIAARLDTTEMTFGDAEDFVKAVLIWPGKPVLDIEIMSTDAYADTLFHLIGSKGTLRASMGKIEYKYIEPESEFVHKLVLSPYTNAEGRPAYCSEKLNVFEFGEDVVGTSFDVAVEKYYQNVYSHIVDGKPLVVKPSRVRQQIAIMEEIHKQNPLKVKY